LKYFLTSLFLPKQKTFFMRISSKSCLTRNSKNIFQKLAGSIKISLMMPFLFGAIFLTNQSYGQSNTNNSQWGKNGKASAPESPVLWANGNAQAQNSHFVEGQSVPTRIELDGLTAGVPASVTFNINIIQGNNGEHAFDFFTGPNRIAETVSPLDGLSGYGAVSYFTLPIPNAGNTGGVPAGYYDQTAIKMACQQGVDAGTPSKNSIWIYNGTITSITYLWGDEDGASTQHTYCTVTFTPSSTKTLLVVGCHIAQEEFNNGCAGWGTGKGATAIGGSPYHFHIDNICSPLSNCVTLGSQDQQMAADAVIIPPTCSITPSTATVCSGATATFTASGIGGSGGAPYTFAWTGPGGFTAITVGVAGTYSVIVSDKDGNPTEAPCSAELIVNTVSLSLEKTDVSCNGGSTGSVTATFSGGTAPYTATLNAVAQGVVTSPKTFSGLTAGSYTVVVTDALGCTASQTISVSQPTALTCNAVPTNPLCFGGTGTITVTPTGGTGTKTYTISGPANVTGAATGVFTGLAAGSYTVTTTDANGCTTTCSATITVPPQLTCNAVPTNPLCFGGTGTITVTPTGGTGTKTYTISGPANVTGAATGIFTGLAGGSYTVTTTDANGCTTTCSATITVPPQLTCNAVPTNPLCFGGTGTITVTPTGGTGTKTYTISGPANVTGAATGIFTGLAGGSYTVTTTDANGCTTTCSATITVPSELIATDGHVGTCVGTSNGSVTITFSGGTGPYTIEFNGVGGFVAQTSPKTYSGLAAGPYTWIVKDANGCTTNGAETVNAIPLPVVSCSATGPIDITSLAHSSQLSVDFTGSDDTDPDNYTYVWTEDGAGSFNFNNIKNPVYTAGVLDAGGTINFTVTVTHKTTGCTKTSNCSVNVSAAGTCPTVETVPVCNGTTNSYTASRAPTANETWVWSADNNAIVNAPNGQQTVSVTAGATSYTLTLTITFANPELNTPNPLECTYEVTVNACGGNCTYTQGKYGNKSPACDGDGPLNDGNAYTYPTVTDMIKALLGVGGVPNPLVVGSNGKFVTVPATATAAVLLNASMPGGSTPRELWGSCTVETPVANCWKPSNDPLTSYLTKQGKINNVLLSQTIALGLNMRISGTLAAFELQAGEMATAKPDGGCGSKTFKTRACVWNAITLQWDIVNEYMYRTISQSVINALTNNGYDVTVAGLYALANDALGNTDGVVGKEGLITGATLSDITAAIDAINNAFDECRIFVGWNIDKDCGPAPGRRSITGPIGPASEVGKLTVGTYPNPFKDNVRFIVSSPVSGQAVLEVYNMFGQKLQTVYKGYMAANTKYAIEYNAPEISNQSLIYTLRIADKKVTGKLIHIGKE
jgi:hypothetical protein